MSTPAAVTISKRPTWSQDALRRAQPCRPARDFITTNRPAAQLVSQAADAQREADRLRDQGRLLLAERLETHIEQLLRGAHNLDRACSLLIPTGSDEYTALPAPGLADAASWLYDTPAPLPEAELAQLLTPLSANIV